MSVREARVPVRISRRDLVTGTVGVALGASVAVGVGATVDHSHVGVLRAPSPGEELMTEHGVLKRVLLAYRAMSERLGRGERLPSGAVIDAAQIIADYVESFHEGLEEAYVFPRVARQPEHAALVTTLLVQHDRGRHLTAAIIAATSANTANADRALHQYLDQFVTMYEPHEAWEDTVIYPALRAHTSQRVLDQLADQFASEESGRYSDLALAQILDRVSGVEQQLGIHNLAAFTPPRLDTAVNPTDAPG